MSEKNFQSEVKSFIVISVSICLLFSIAVNGVYSSEGTSLNVHEVDLHLNGENETEETNNWTFERFTAAPRDSEIKLSWSFSENNSRKVSIGHYDIIRDGEKIAQVEETSYEDKDVENGVEYTYRVEAVDEDGSMIEASEEITATPESYWWLWLALPINITAIIMVVYHFRKNNWFFDEDQHP